MLQELTNHAAHLTSGQHHWHHLHGLRGVAAGSIAWGGVVAACSPTAIAVVAIASSSLAIAPATRAILLAIGPLAVPLAVGRCIVAAGAGVPPSAAPACPVALAVSPATATLLGLRLDLGARHFDLQPQADSTLSEQSIMP